MHFDPLGMLRRANMMNVESKYNQGAEVAMDTSGPSGGQMLSRVMPQTLTEILDQQIRYHENEINKIKEAKAAISPEVEKALNALAKL